MDSHGDELSTWGLQQDLTPETLQFLREQGFTTLRRLRRLTPEIVEKSFQIPDKLPLEQCLALSDALLRLRETTDVHVTKPDQKTDNVPVLIQEEQTSTAQPQPGRGPSNITEEASSSELQYRFLLVGKTGSGKSTTGNTILGAEMFDTDVTFGSVTGDCQLTRHSNNGIMADIMDSPGLFDTSRSHEEISADIVRAVACMHPGPHAILYVIRLGRYTEEEFGVYKRLKALFDDDLVRYVIVVFTGGDHLETEGKNIQRELRNAPTGLRQVLAECNNRYVVFNNLAKDKRPQVQLLYQEVRKVMALNHGRPYVCPKYNQVGQGLEEEVAKRLEKVEEKDLEKLKYVQQLKRQTEMLEQTAAEERELWEQKEREREETLKQHEKEAEERMQTLKLQLDEQQLTAELREREEEDLRRQLEEERELQRQQLQAEREVEKKRYEARKREIEEAKRKHMEQDRKMRAEHNRMYMETVRKMQDQIAQNQIEDSEFYGAIFNGVAAIVVKGITSALI